MSLRDNILDELSTMYSRDALSLEDYERRVDLVMATSDDQALRSMNHDLASVRGDYRSTAGQGNYMAGGQGHYAGGQGHGGDVKDLVAIFSGNSLRGNFSVPSRINAAAIFGGLEIDLREVMIPPQGVVIEAAAIFGGIEIFIPEGVNVQTDGFAIFGGFDHPHGRNYPGAPVVRIVGTAIFGGVEVKYPRLLKN